MARRRNGISSDIPSATWSRVSEMRTFFAHQSVGGNLLAGIRSCSGVTGPPSLPIVGIGRHHFRMEQCCRAGYVGQKDTAFRTAACSTAEP